MRVNRNILWSALGATLPILSAVIAIPTLIDSMGDARFGVLSLAWILVGYFSFLDLGLGRALTHLVAQKVGAKKSQEIPGIIRSALMIMTAMGAVGGLIVAVLAPWLVGSILVIPDHLNTETLYAIYFLAVSIPVVIVTSGLRGILEGLHRFDLVNIVRAPVGALTYIGPLLVLSYTVELPAIVAVLLAGRLASLIIYSVICLRIYPAIRKNHHFSKSEIRHLMAFGGWMTLSNIAGPLLLYLGRLFLAAAVSIEAVAYFSTPYDIIATLLLVPGVYTGVLYPVFAQQFRGNSEGVRPLYLQWQFYTFASMLPLCLITFFLAETGISLWISPEFANHSYRVAQVLAVGIFINSFGHISQSVIQAYGRPDITAKLHVVELIMYAPYLWWLISHYGIEGAAFAWVIRVSISTVALTVIANHCLSSKITNNDMVKTA